MYGTNNAHPVSNTRGMRFLVEVADAAESNATMFRSHYGDYGDQPFVTQSTTAPTPNDELAQLRLNLVITKVRELFPTVNLIDLADDSWGTVRPDHLHGPAVIVELHGRHTPGGVEDPAWVANVATPRFMTADITDTVGTGGSPFLPKTRSGFQSLLDELATVSYDGGTTGPFGTLSAGGSIVLPDGSVTVGAPTLANGVTPSGLRIVNLD